MTHPIKPTTNKSNKPAVKKAAKQPILSKDDYHKKFIASLDIRFQNGTWVLFSELTYAVVESFESYADAAKALEAKGGKSPLDAWQDAVGDVAQAALANITTNKETSNG